VQPPRRGRGYSRGAIPAARTHPDPAMRRPAMGPPGGDPARQRDRPPRLRGQSPDAGATTPGASARTGPARSPMPPSSRPGRNPRPLRLPPCSGCSTQPPSGSSTRPPRAAHRPRDRQVTSSGGACPRFACWASPSASASFLPVASKSGRPRLRRHKTPPSTSPTPIQPRYGLTARPGQSGDPPTLLRSFGSTARPRPVHLSTDVL